MGGRSELNPNRYSKITQPLTYKMMWTQTGAYKGPLACLALTGCGRCCGVEDNCDCICIIICCMRFICTPTTTTCSIKWIFKNDRNKNKDFKSRKWNTEIVVVCFNALTLLAGCREEHPACWSWVMRCRHGYLSGLRCRSAYGPAATTATPSSLAPVKFRMVYLSGQAVLKKTPLNERCYSRNCSQHCYVQCYNNNNHHHHHY